MEGGNEKLLLSSQQVRRKENFKAYLKNNCVKKCLNKKVNLNDMQPVRFHFRPLNSEQALYFAFLVVERALFHVNAAEALGGSF